MPQTPQNPNRRHFLTYAPTLAALPWLTALSEKKGIRRITLGIEGKELIYQVENAEAA
jgi:hypothetical protein